jgi:DNA-damage-inducible protein D
MGEITPIDPGSPFDRIRRERPDGSEYWSARDLYPLMGYASWRNFGEAIQRGIHAGRNTGMDVTSQFARVHNLVDRPQGGRGAVEDMEMSREAAYLVALNGDPTKRESAAAQAYFVVRTRQAETASQELALPRDYASALRALADTVEREERARAELAIAAPKVERFDQLQSTQDGLLVGQVAQALGIPGLGGGNLWKYLRVNRWVFQTGTQPTADAKDAGYMIAPLRVWDDTDRSERRGVDPQTYVTPQGVVRLGVMVTAEGWTKGMRRKVTGAMIEALGPRTFRTT